MEAAVATTTPANDLPGVGSPGGILLISCYELGHQPFSLASPLAFLRRAGFAPTALDVSVDPLSPELIRKARFVGISVPMHTALRLGLQVAEKVRELNPDCHVCFYGLYALLNAAYLFDRGADSVIGGEFEEPLVALVSALDRGAASPIPGVRQHHEQDPSVPAAHLKRLTFVPPERETLPVLKRYARLEYQGELRPAGYTETSRGCKHLCRHCPIPPVYGGRFFAVPVEVVMEDVRRQVEMGAQHITFGDPDFLNGPTHALRVARELHAHFPQVTFDATVKIEHILRHRELIPELGSLGCLFLVSAVESLNSAVLEPLLKHHDAAGVTEALAITRAAGIYLRPSLMPFTPWETLDSYRALLDWIDEQDLVECVDPVQLSIRLLIPPGSHVLQIPGVEALLGPLDEAAFSYRWTHPDPRMDELHARVSKLVADAADADTEAAEVYDQVRAAANEAAGIASGPIRPRPPERVKPPRLTESWFC